MSATNSGNGTGPHADARPIVLVRYRPEAARETARTVHLLPLPPRGRTAATSALCGALLHPDEIEPVTPGHGMPCSLCLLSHLAQHPPPPPSDTTPTPEVTGADSDPPAATTTYQAWHWPVTLRHNQLWLTLDDDAIALIIPTPLATTVTTILTTRRCPPAVLAHPYAREHLVLLAGEPYGVAPPCPLGVHRVTGSVLLPPTVTPRGPVTWVHPPQQNSLQFCREIDLFGALRTALHDPLSPQ